MTESFVTPEQERVQRTSSAAKAVSDLALTAGSRATVSLLEAKIEATKDQLVTAGIAEVPALQAEVRLMRTLITVANGRPEGI